jgi:hypothetical protein
MGCCCSNGPSPEDFLVAQPPATELLLPGMSRDMLMNQWSIQIHNATDSPAGRGPSEQLNIHDAATNAPLARLIMPPHCSFGVGAYMTDASGAVVAWLRSASDTRPYGFQSSSYCIFSPKPQVPGQQPALVIDAAAGTQGYLWATLTRKPFTKTVTVTNSAGQLMWHGCVAMCPGPGHTGMQTFLWSMMNKQGPGIMHMSKTDGRTDLPPAAATHKAYVIKNLWAVRVADGVDAALALCVWAASRLTLDELVGHGQVSGDSH